MLGDCQDARQQGDKPMQTGFTRRQMLQAAAATLSVPLTAHAQPYPAKPIRYIVPVAAGGGSDMIGRVVTERWGRALGQAFVVTCSWLKWLGVPLNWLSDKYEPEMGILFTSTLEQPIMSTLLAVLLWHCRDRWAAKLGTHGHRIVHLALLLTVTNVLFIMTGRTGYLVMLVGLSLSGFMATPARWRLAALAAPVLLAVAAFTLSPRLHDRVMQVQQDITQYRQGNINSSQGLRLDYWRAAVEGIAERPWVGHGVGSYSRVYTEHDGFEKRILRDPHQQYLFWWVEGGLVALALLLSFLISLVTYARQLPMAPRRALVCTAALAATMGLSACPFFGAGMGEHLMLMIAALLATHPQVPTPQIRGV